MRTKCLIVEDEPLAQEIIESYIAKMEDIELIAKCDNAVTAFEILNKRHIDLIFLDIQMPEITGLEFLKSLRNPPKIIITTAYRKYAIDGFELDVVDYLLKPISFERFLKAINKYYQIDIKVLSYKTESNESNRDFIYVKENKKVVKIFLNTILFIECVKDYVTIHTTSKRVTTKSTISDLELKLPKDRFLRIHRSFIVSLPKINAFTASSIEIGEKELTIGRNYKNRVLKELKYSKI